MSFGIPFGKNNEVAGTECQPLGSPADYVKQVPLSVGAMETMEGKQMHQSQPNQELDGASLTEVLLKAKRALRPRQSAASPSFTWDTATSGTLGRQTCFPIARPSIVPSLPCHTETAGWQMSYGSQQAITPETDHVNYKEAGLSPPSEQIQQEALAGQLAPSAFAALPPKGGGGKSVDGDRPEDTTAIAENVLSRARNALRRVHVPPQSSPASAPEHFGGLKQTSEMKYAQVVPWLETSANKDQDPRAAECKGSAAALGGEPPSIALSLPAQPWERDQISHLELQHAYQPGQGNFAFPVSALQYVPPSLPPQPTPPATSGSTWACHAAPTSPLLPQVQYAAAVAAMSSQCAFMPCNLDGQLPTQLAGEAGQQCIIASAPPAGGTTNAEAAASPWPVQANQCAAPSTCSPVKEEVGDPSVTSNAQVTAPGPKRRGVAPKGPAPPPGKTPKSPSKPPPPKASAKAKVHTRSQDQEDSQAPFQRKIFWKPLDLQDSEGTLFSETSEANQKKDSCFDPGALTRMFEDETVKIRENKRRSVKLLNKARTRHIGLKLLGDHRARNIAIVLKRLCVSTQELTEILQELRWEAAELSIDDLEQILEVIPTQEEAKQLVQHSSPEAREQLRDIEQMVLPLAMLNRATARVRLLCIARSAHFNFRSNVRSLALVRAACNSIQNSAKLREVMLLALKIGNYINHGDSSKGAKAISVGSLMTLKDFKTGQMSSLHFLCASLLLSQPGCNAAEIMGRELRPAVNLAKLQVTCLVSSVQTFTRDFDIVASECRSHMMEYASEAADGNEYDENSGNASHEECDDTLNKHEEKATQFLEDVMKIRGCARSRLRCMRRVVEKLNKLLLEEKRNIVQQVHSTLRFCGVSVALGTEISQELEPLLLQLAEFVRVFRQHWDVVQSDLPKYQELFGKASTPSSATGDTIS